MNDSFRLLTFLIVAGTDVGVAIYYRYYSSEDTRVIIIKHPTQTQTIDCGLNNIIQEGSKLNYEAKLDVCIFAKTLLTLQSLW